VPVTIAIFFARRTGAPFTLSPLGRG